jgi:hypothetical protein
VRTTQNIVLATTNHRGGIIPRACQTTRAAFVRRPLIMILKRIDVTVSKEYLADRRFDPTASVCVPGSGRVVRERG